MEELRTTFNNKNILITGGTGSFGNQLVKFLLEYFTPNKIIILSRDEFKQFLMQEKYPTSKYPCLRYFIGDIRDYNRLETAFKGVNIIIHTAALKQVPALEYNPEEAIKTNIYGAENIIRAAIKCGVDKVMAISTDKCVSPVNLYGATKLVFERLFVAANNKSDHTTFSISRYGNVLGSRGSVMPKFLEQQKTGTFTITDERMTRFTITIEEAAKFVLRNINYMVGGEVFVPKLPSYNILQLAKVIDPNCKVEIIGKRPGEKLHECMVNDSEAYLVLSFEKFMIIKPFVQMKQSLNYDKAYQHLNGKKMDEDTTYNSHDNVLINDDVLLNYINDYKKTIQN